MKTLLLFDLHYQSQNPVQVKKLENILRIEDNFNAVILGGDNAELSSGLRDHKILFQTLQEKFSCPIGFVIGNHELWGKLVGISSTNLMHEVFPRLAQQQGVVYLEENNLTIAGTTFVGTYGHFDYSFFREGKGVKKEDLLKGVFFAGSKKITWKDIIYMDWQGRTDEKVCAELVRGFESRLKNNVANVSISHTIPRLTLNGWPKCSEQYFMEAYSGSDLIGDVLERNGGKNHFCGHTHIRAVANVGKTYVLNIGADYNNLRYVVLSVEKDKEEVNEREII